MTTSLLSPSTVAQIGVLRLRGFETSYAIANPKAVLVLDRDGIEIDAQRVLVDWVLRRSSRATGGFTAMRETESDIVFRRPEPFDVKADDRFRLQNGEIGVGTAPTGVVTRVYRDKGYVFAEATLDVRSA